MAGCPIFRYVKHKNASSLGGAMGHHLRTIPTKNADPARTHLNEILFGIGDVKAMNLAMKTRTNELVKRKDANRAVEFFLGASHDFWSEGGDWRELGKAHFEHLKSEFGEENILGFGVHLDETTPHFWAVVLPIHEGKLRSNHWFDGPKKCREYIDRSVEFFKPLNMTRAREGIKASHTDVELWRKRWPEMRLQRVKFSANKTAD